MTSVTSMLTSIGIGAPPASFSDATTAAANQRAAVGGLTTTVSGINTSLSLLTATGAPASVTGPMKDTLASGNALLNNASSMTPAELTKKTGELQSQQDINKMNHATTMRNQDLADLTAAEKAAIKIIKPILADKITSQATRDACVRLLEDIQDAKRAISRTKFKGEGFGGRGSRRLGSRARNASGSVSETPPVYIRPDVLTPDDVDIYINSIQDAYDDETDNNLRKLSRNATNLYTKYVWPAIFFSVFAFCVVLGGILSSNACLPNELYSVYNRAFYFIYGAILFPITLPMYGILYPPEWYSTICPLFSNDGTKPVVADELDGPASVLTSLTSGISSLKSLTTPGGLASMFTKRGGGDPVITPPAATPTLKGATYYFYPLVPNPTAKANLGKVSLVATVLVWGYLFSIGAMNIMSSF